MPPPIPGDPTGPDLAADADAAAQLVRLARQAAAVPLPPPRLSGWSSLCAGEYGGAMRLLHGQVLQAAEALEAAGRPV